MPKTKKESLVFTVIMCALMVLSMSTYNVVLHSGSFTAETFSHVIKGFIPGYIVGMICDWFIVSKPAKAVALNFINEKDAPLKKVIIISSCMVCGMVLCMSMFGAILNNGITSQLPLFYIKNIGTNFIVALPLQLLIVGPITRYLFSKIFYAERA